MKLLDYWKHFLTDTVNLNQSRIDTLDNRVLAISNFLKGDNGLGDAAEDLIAQGSYAHRTIIRPVGNHEFDADVLLLISEQDGWEPKDYVQNLYTVFRGSSIYREMVSRQTRCVLVNYANDFHIDVVPYLIRDDGHWITNRSTNKLEATNPEGFNDWLLQRDQIATRRLVEVIRIMKHLRDYKQTFSVRSVVLSFLLAERVSESTELLHPKCYDDLPSAFIRLIIDLDNWLKTHPELPVLIDPACPTQNFHDRWKPDEYTNFRAKISHYRGKAEEAWDATTVADSLASWQAIFGPDFKKPPDTRAAEAGKSLARAADYEQDIVTDLRFPIDLSAGYRIRVRGRVRKKHKMGAYHLSTRGDRILKNREIDFRLATCTVPEPFDLYWKVRNAGREAAAANQLRGQIIKDPGTLTRYEHTAYRGSHYVEVYAVKNGRCVALDRQRVVVNN